jgi:23S rRNA (adenine2503-C2)-methyltransferase
MTYEDLAAGMAARYGKGAYHAGALYREIFKNGNPDWHRAGAFRESPGLTRKLLRDLDLHPVQVHGTRTEGDLVKLAVRLRDGEVVESVIIPMAGRTTLCISSQVGCRMGCRFCETGRMGLRRHLTAEEMAGQVYLARWVLGHRVGNVVFMGMGEPLDNPGPVRQAIRVLTDDHGFNLARRRITVSTAGLVKGIRDLALGDQPPPRLAVSLNAPDDRIRSRIMPVNRAHPMAELRRSLLAYPLDPKGAIFIEYVMMAGVNDAPEHADELARFLRPLRVKVNLIPCNPRSDHPFRPPSPETVERFRERLVAHDLFVRRRALKGQSVMAACGQLGGKR